MVGYEQRYVHRNEEVLAGIHGEIRDMVSKVFQGPMVRVWRIASSCWELVKRQPCVFRINLLTEYASSELVCVMGGIRYIVLFDIIER